MNTTALAIIQPDELDTIQRTGRMLAASGYFDAKGDSPMAIAMMATKILAGREIGIGPFASVNGIHIIKGKPSIGANLLAAAVKSSPRYDYRVRELSDKVCKIEFFERHGDKLESLGISEFTKEDAVKAQTQNMDKFAKNMLFARAMSNGVRFYAPDVFNGNAVYVPEELGANVDGDGNIIDVTPRQVDAATGNDLVDRFEALGQELYGDQWEPVSRRNISRISNGMSETSDGLTIDQLQRLLDGMTRIKDKRDPPAGEIVAPVTDNPFTDVDFDKPTHPLASQSQLNHMHMLGNEWYRTKEAWDKARPVWAKKASGDATESSKELSPEQVDWVIEKLTKRLNERAQQEAQPEQVVA